MRRTQNYALLSPTQGAHGLRRRHAGSRARCHIETRTRVDRDVEAVSVGAIRKGEQRQGGNLTVETEWCVT